MHVLVRYGEVQRKVAGDLAGWRHQATWMDKMVVSLLFALLTILASMVRVYVPFTPVPFTGQVLAVLASAVVLGRFAPVSQVLYLGIGGGLGLFAAGGFAALWGVTGGYLLGFVCASFVLGELVERRGRWSVPQISLAMALAVGVIYLCGVVQLSLVLHLDLWEAVVLGAVPFVVVDGIKVLMAIGLCSFFLPARRGENG